MLRCSIEHDGAGANAAMEEIKAIEEKQKQAHQAARAYLLSKVRTQKAD